jgi:hypothetical protein
VRRVVWSILAVTLPTAIIAVVVLAPPVPRTVPVIATPATIVLCEGTICTPSEPTSDLLTPGQVRYVPEQWFLDLRAERDTLVLRYNRALRYEVLQCAIVR